MRLSFCSEFGVRGTFVRALSFADGLYSLEIVAAAMAVKMNTLRRQPSGDGFVRRFTRRRFSQIEMVFALFTDAALLRK